MCIENFCFKQDENALASLPQWDDDVDKTAMHTTAKETEIVEIRGIQ